MYLAVRRWMEKGRLLETVRSKTRSWENPSYTLGKIKSRLDKVQALQCGKEALHVLTKAPILSLICFYILLANSSLLPELGMPFSHFLLLPKPPPFFHLSKLTLICSSRVNQVSLTFASTCSQALCPHTHKAGVSCQFILWAPPVPGGPHHSVTELTVHCLSPSLEFVHCCLPSLITVPDTQQVHNKHLLVIE